MLNVGIYLKKHTQRGHTQFLPLFINTISGHSLLN
jgi:hypothetical protein